LPELVPPQCADKEEPERRNLTDHRVHGELALLEQVRLITAQVVRTELVRRLCEVLGECRNRPQIAAGCTIGVITTLEFLQHHFA